MNEGIYQGLSRIVKVYEVYMSIMYDHDISESFNQSEISPMNPIFSVKLRGTFSLGMLQGLVICRKNCTHHVTGPTTGGPYRKNI